MNILLIGNGFDLEHGLPTKYADFLEFCKKTFPIFSLHDDWKSLADYSKMEYEQEHLKNWNIAQIVKESLMDAFETRNVKTGENGEAYIVTDNHSLNELYSLTFQNAWLNYFCNRVSSIGENWIDFESEISNVVQALDYRQKYTPPVGRHKEIPEPYNSRLVEISRAAHFSFSHYRDDQKALQALTTLLDYELGRIIRALEIYLAVFVNNIPVDVKSPDIENLNPDCVLSFNYSNTHQRLYGESGSTTYDFLHGKASTSNTVQSCNLVLGIDEYLDDNKKNDELEFISFKKYYQRIYKSTGNQYLSWVEKMDTEYSTYLANQNKDRSLNVWGFDIPLPKFINQPANTLWIFGHSLDITDRDILRLLICNESIQTKIFYYRAYEHDKRTLGKLIKNLIRIIGQDELIRRTGGFRKTIEFIPQTLRE